MSVSILIPFESEEPYRLRNLEFVKAWYRDRFPSADIVVSGHAPDRRGWIKAEAVRSCLAEATGDTLVLADADCICESVVRAVQEVETWAVPHRVTRRLSPASTDSVLSGLEPFDGIELDGKGYASVAGGGITVIKREIYERIPLDPRFSVTHGEDTSWAHALRLLVGQPWTSGKPGGNKPSDLTLEQILWHLWHPPIPPMGSRLDENRGLARRYEGARRPQQMEALLSEMKAWKPQPPVEKLEDSGARCAVIVPVLNRPESAKRFMESVSGDCHVYAIASPSDIKTILAWESEGATVFCSDRGSTFAQKVNCGFERTQEPWLFFVGDDVQFHSGWLDAALGAAGEQYDVVSTNDLARNDLDALAIHPLVRRTYIERLGMSWDGPGLVAHEGYSHWFVDCEWSELALVREAMVFAPDSVVEHLHPLWGKGDSDATYELGQKLRKQDQRTFNARLTLAKRKRLARRA